VTITISAAGHHSEVEVEVTYQLTALTGPGGPRLREFAGPYPAYLQSWQDAITARLRTAGTRLPSNHGNWHASPHVSRSLATGSRYG